MKFSCTQENLNQVLSIVSHIAAKNANLPILSNILIKAENKSLTVSATNLEIGVNSIVRGMVEVDGEFTVDARLLASYISLLPKDRIDCELIGDELKITCQKQKTKIRGQVSVDFPLIPRLAKEKPFILNADEFKTAINSVVFAVSNSEIRPEISGVYLGFGEKNLILTATDSYRLAEKSIEYVENGRISGESNEEYQEEKVIVPVRSLQEITRIISVFRDDLSLDSVGNIEVYLEESQIMFVYGGVELVSRLIDGQFPEYTQIIPNDNRNKVEISVSDLVKAVKTASLFAKSGVFDVKLDCKTNPDELLVISASTQIGENISSIEMKREGDGEEIVLNYKYLLDGVSNIGIDRVVLEMSDANNPCLFRPVGKTDYLYLIMPIRQ